jgi:F-type H+-transporting ATPase subunit c
LSKEESMRSPRLNKLRKRLVALLSGLGTTAVSALAFAQSEGAGVNAEYHKWVAVAAGLGIAIAAFGGALSQGRTAATALDGIARNPSAADKLFTPMILGLALIESLVIYSLVISFMLVGKLP